LSCAVDYSFQLVDTFWVARLCRFGRVAARYRLDVDQLVVAADIEFDLGSDGQRAIAPSQDDALSRISALARVAPSALSALARNACRPSCPGDLWFCCRCVFVNPIEVESPYWRFGWIFEGPGECPIHRAARERLPAAALAKARNMDKVILYISQHRATLFEWETHRPSARPRRRHSRRLADFVHTASAFRDHG
jgi:hypothetical protein